MSAVPYAPVEQPARNSPLIPYQSAALDAIWRTTSDAMVLSDRDGIVLAVNPACVRLCGHPAEQIVGSGFTFILPEETRCWAIEQYNEIFNAPGTPFTFEAVVVRADGAERIVESRAELIVDNGEPVAVLSVIRDITDTKQAQNSLRVSEERFRAAQDISLDAFTILRSVRDEAGQIIDFEWEYVNPAAGQILQHAPEALVGRRLLEVLPNNDPSGLFANYKNVVETGESHDYELRYEGEGISGWFRNMTVKLGDGVAISFADITRRKEMEEALRRSEERFLLALHDSNTTVFEQDLDLRYVWVYNPRFEYTPESIIGKTDAEMFSAEDSERLTAIKRRVLETGQGEQVQTTVTSSEGTRHYELHVEPRYDSSGNLLGITCASLNVTEYRALEERQSFIAEAGLLLASSLDQAELLRRLARLATGTLADWCIIYLRGEDGRTYRAASAHVDPAKAPLLDELNRLPLDVHQVKGVDLVMETQQPMHVENLEAWLPEESQYGPQMALIRELGPGSGMAVPLVARGNVLGALSLARADKGRPFTPADLSLAEEIASRAALFLDNSILYQQAQSAVRIREDFLSIASHDLRTPLTSMHLRLQILLQHARKGTLRDMAPDRLLATLEATDRQVMRLAKLIDDLLDVSRIQAGRFELHGEPIDLAEVVAAVVERLAEEAAQSGSTIALHSTSVVGEWDSTRLEQVIGNLLSNAIKYGAGKPIAVSVERDDGSARLVIADHGIGIEPERLPAIFERFERGVAAEHYSGVGLGLYIARRIVKAYGGTIRVESTVGEGSTFTVELPL
ncbi:MAG: PAS domain-containing protein [Anaerolineae bacterium]